MVLLMSSPGRTRLRIAPNARCSRRSSSVYSLFDHHGLLGTHGLSICFEARPLLADRISNPCEIFVSCIKDGFKDICRYTENMFDGSDREAVVAANCLQGNNLRIRPQPGQLEAVVNDADKVIVLPFEDSLDLRELESPELWHLWRA